MPLGDIFRMTSWTDVGPNLRVGFKMDNRKQVALMMLLGYENKDGSYNLDLETALNRLGWFRKSEVGETQHEMDEAERQTPRK